MPPPLPTREHSLNIQKLEAVLQDMRSAEFSDVPSASAIVRQWAEQIDEAISDHLIESLGISFSELPSVERETDAE